MKGDVSQGQVQELEGRLQDLVTHLEDELQEKEDLKKQLVVLQEAQH